jgi:hypothetical protein
MAKKVKTMGTIAMLKMVERCPFHILEADRISEALKRIIRHMTIITLTSDTPNVANIPNTDVVLMVLLTVLSVDDNISPLKDSTNLDILLGINSFSDINIANG